MRDKVKLFWKIVMVIINLIIMFPLIRELMEFLAKVFQEAGVIPFLIALFVFGALILLNFFGLIQAAFEKRWMQFVGWAAAAVVAGYLVVPLLIFTFKFVGFMGTMVCSVLIGLFAVVGYWGLWRLPRMILHFVIDKGIDLGMQ